jgi:hypothetical protein
MPRRIGPHGDHMSWRLGPRNRRGESRGGDARAGFVEIVTTRVAQVTAASLREFHERVRTRADTTLVALDDRAFATGLAALERYASLKPRRDQSSTTSTSSYYAHQLHRGSPEGRGAWR